MIEQLAAARGRLRTGPVAASPVAGASAPVRSAPAPAAATPPPALPDAFDAEFASVNAARETRRTARKREKEGKPPKDAPIALRAVEPALRAHALAASSLRTQNLEAVFEAMDARAGQTVRFRVVAWERQPDGGHLATRVTLEGVAEEP